MQASSTKNILKIAIVSLLTLGCLALTYYFHVVLRSSTLFTHLFYIPVVLSAFWWKRKGLLVPLLLAGYMLFSRYCCWPQEAMSNDDLLRTLVLVLTASIVALLSGRVEKAERKQKESEARYRLVFEHMSDGVAVCRPLGQGEEDFILIDCNQAAEQIDGVNRQNHRGKNVLEVFPRMRGSDLLEVLQRVWRTGQAETWLDAFEQDGRVTRWHEYSVYRLPSSEVVLVHNDRTEQKRTEQKALQLASLVESSDAAIISMNLEGEILSWNSGAANVYGYSEEEMVGDCILTLIPAEHWGTMLQSLDEVSNGETRDHYETVHMRKDGRRIDVSLIVSPLKDLKGNVVGASMIARNIMRRKEAESALRGSYEELERKVEDRTAELSAKNEQLQQEIAEREKAEQALQESTEKIKLFAYLICHDLKSPAIGIYGLARLLRKQYGDLIDEKGRTYCEQILRASEQLGALVEKINGYIAAKEAVLDISPLEVEEIFAAVRDEFSQRVEQRGILWIESAASEQIRADRLSLIRIFRNLVDNALKYGGETLSMIRLGYDESDEAHIFSVRDNGAGIKCDDFEKIFGLFQRNSRDKRVEGLGLGLAGVKEAAERHGGRVWVESTSDEGTMFFVSISKTLD
ncbi:sensor histidine kinase [Desulfoferrobacter suflitae]|uniref:sensor histidine kinase n=1 Tax=Desulfoferrobacter suflitae TaxID=2865782 RepID=UPI00216478F9|nr:PAS domain S-box protein [Desulfoferrobacter suflitae]MCK8603753.1 PAS domain S-box protein [Desulfoferrobacter suflitae]